MRKREKEEIRAGLVLVSFSLGEQAGQVDDDTRKPAPDNQYMGLIIGERRWD